MSKPTPPAYFTAAAPGRLSCVPSILAATLLIGCQHREAPAPPAASGAESKPQIVNAQRSKPLHTLSDLLALSPDELEGTDVALMNLLCAERLPGAESLKVEDCLATLDAWAEHARQETQRNRHRFREDPGYYYHSEAFYQMLMLAVVVYEDFGVRYNPKWIAPPSEPHGDDRFFADSRDIFLHGLLPSALNPPHGLNSQPSTLNPPHGTCSSMPMLYIALGRRLGYPLKLVTTREHLFMRWDGPTERFDMDATGKGLEKYDDEHYRKWPFPVAEQEIKDEGCLRSLSAREELSVCLAIRGSCLLEAGRWPEATAAFQAAYRYAPDWKGNQVMLAQAQQRQRSARPAQPATRPLGRNRAAPSNPLEPDPLRRIQNPGNPNPPLALHPDWPSTPPESPPPHQA